MSAAEDRAMYARLHKSYGKRGALGLVTAIKAVNTRPDRERPNQTKIKVALIARQGGKCEACEHAMADPSLLHVHHVIPIAKGGADEMENCALLCPNCHATAHWAMRRNRKERPVCVADLLRLLKSVG